MLERVFHLKENKTDVKTELVAALTTFVAMAYILAVNPAILSATGMEKPAVLFATAIASFIGCLLMGLLTNYPFALAPGLGMTTYFAYTVCIGMGYSYKLVLLAVFVEGLIFVALSLSGFRDRPVDSIPISLKRAISAGIGLFIAFIGFQGAGIIVNNDSTLVSLIDFNAAPAGTGLMALLAIIGLFVICILSQKQIRGAILIGMLGTWVPGILCQLTGLLQVGGETGIPSLLPDFAGFSLRAAGANVGACFDFASMHFRVTDFAIIIFTLLYMDMFDTMGTLVGVAGQSGIMDEDGKLPRTKRTFLADAIATSAGAVLGTSTTTTYVESSAGVAVGGRTGLTAVITGFLFLISVFLYPVFVAIPSFATAPALIYVGFLMMKNLMKMDFNSITEGVPAFLCMTVTVLSYSISDGIGAGIIACALLNLITGKKERVNGVMIVLALAFVLKYIFL